MKLKTIVLLVFLVACDRPTAPSAPSIIMVQHTSSTQAWLSGLYSCAIKMGVVVDVNTRAVDYFDLSYQLSIRIGEAEDTLSMAYQIGTEEIVVIVHPDNPLKRLTMANVVALFSGEIQNWSEIGGKDLPVQVWTFGSGEDIRQIFDAVVMQHRPLTSQARLAASAEAMTAGVEASLGAVGFLPRSLVDIGLKSVELEDIPTPLSFPVLIFTSPDADQLTMKLVACIQDN